MDTRRSPRRSLASERPLCTVSPASMYDTFAACDGEGIHRMAEAGTSCITLPWRAGREEDASMLREHEVHVWRVDVDAPQAANANFEILSGDERRRASRFKFDVD